VLIDDFGNHAQVQAVQIIIKSRRIEPNVTDPLSVIKTVSTGSMGIGVFTNLMVQTRGSHVLMARFFHVQQGCLQSSQFLMLSDNETAHICDVRSLSTTGDSCVDR